MQLNRAPSQFPVNRAAIHPAAEGDHDALDEQAISVMAKAWAHPDDYELLKVPFCCWQAKATLDA